jgi:hypothetical protein
VTTSVALKVIKGSVYAMRLSVRNSRIQRKLRDKLCVAEVEMS